MIKDNFTSQSKPLRAFSLIELLVVISILAILISILLPAISSVRKATRSLVCQTKMHNVSTDFRLFSDDYTRDYRDGINTTRFSAWQYLKMQYEVLEFDKRPVVPLEYAQTDPYKSDHPLICPTGPNGLARTKRGIPTTTGIADLTKLSYTFNRRLMYAPVCLPPGGAASWPVQIDRRILQNPRVPLMFDVDAERMMADPDVNSKPYVPFFSAPQGSESTCNIYGNDKYWFPSFRHDNKLMITFIDGHVIRSSEPLTDSMIDWDYHPPVR